MVKINLLIPAKGVIRDANTNTISIFSIIEEIKAQGFPLFITELYIYFHLIKEKNDSDKFKTNLLVLNNEEEIFKYSITSNFQGQDKNNTTIRLNGLAIKNPGMLKFIIKSGSKLLSSYEVKVELLSKPTVEKKNN